MTTLRTVTLGLLAGFAMVLPARAAETPTEEALGLYQCAGAMGILEGYMEDPNAPITEADRTLSSSLTALEPRFQVRDGQLHALLGDDAVRAIAADLRKDMKSKIDPLRGDPQARTKVVALYRPVLEACIVRGAALPTIP